MSVESVRGTAVVIHFDNQRCIHSRHCVLDRPDVFVPNVAQQVIRNEHMWLETGMVGTGEGKA